MGGWVEYDSRADALSIVFSEEPVARTVEASHGRRIDLDAADRIVAIEVLGVSAGFALDDLAEQFHVEVELREVEPALPSQFYRHYA